LNPGVRPSPAAAGVAAASASAAAAVSLSPAAAVFAAAGLSDGSSGMKESSTSPSCKYKRSKSQNFTIVESAIAAANSLLKPVTRL
jgi:hypothetical protein